MPSSKQRGMLLHAALHCTLMSCCRSLKQRLACNQNNLSSRAFEKSLILNADESDDLFTRIARCKPSLNFWPKTYCSWKAL